MADVGEVSDSASVEEGGLWGHGAWGWKLAEESYQGMEGQVGFLSV